MQAYDDSNACEIENMDQINTSSLVGETGTSEKSVRTSKNTSTPWDCALRYLGQRSHSQYELEQKLSRRGFSTLEIEETILRLQRAELIDDEQFAIELTRSLLIGKHNSYKQVRMQLQKRGVSEGAISVALDGNSPEDDFERAQYLASKRFELMRGVEWEVKYRRILSFLGRRGFSEAVCYQVIRWIKEEYEIDKNS